MILNCLRIIGGDCEKENSCTHGLVVMRAVNKNETKHHKVKCSQLLNAGCISIADSWSEGALSMLGLHLSLQAAHGISMEARTTCIESALLVTQGVRYCICYLLHLLRQLRTAL